MENNYPYQNQPQNIPTYGIESSVLTFLNMYRKNLVTNETAKAAYIDTRLGQRWSGYKGSINDDLDSFFNNLIEGKTVEENVSSFFMPKLTEKELNIIKVHLYYLNQITFSRI